jgi:SAM-dependent methyltransferase
MKTADRNYFVDFYKNATMQGINFPDHYLRIQKTYRDDFGGQTALRPVELKGISFALKYINKYDSLLIMGCGSGAQAKYLIDHGYHNITGLDISEKVLEKCRQSLKIKTKCADMCKTGLDSQSFDVVICHRSLHHMFFPFETLQEFGRVSREKVIIINEPVRSGIKIMYKRLMNMNIISSAKAYEYQFNMEDIHRYMNFYGFSLIKSIRNWEIQKGVLVNALLNLFSSGTGNRFTAVYERFPELRKMPL